jgi:hypothetical protein
MPKFSIIVVHYQGVNPHEIFLRGIASLQAQTFRDFEILCYHDGPLLEPEVEFPIAVKCTDQRYNDWGHTLRDMGIREARGDYILHFNADNLLYPEALEEIAREIDRAPRLFSSRDRSALDTNDIIIFPIKMWGLMKFRQHTVQTKGDQNFYLILNGTPPMYQNIDCMQLVMKRELWLAEGGWYDKRNEGDGLMYEQFALKYGYRLVGPVLGEHF